MTRIGALLLAATLLLVPGTTPLRAEDLSVESYCNLSLERLKKAVAAWEETGKGLAPAEEDVLFEKHGTTREVYFAFASDQREEIQSYLDVNPELRKDIEDLSDRLRRLIEREEEG